MGRSMESYSSRNRDNYKVSEGVESLGKLPSYEEHMRGGDDVQSLRRYLDSMLDDQPEEYREAIEATRRAAAIESAREAVLGSYGRSSGQDSLSTHKSLESSGDSVNLDTPRDLEGANPSAPLPPRSESDTFDLSSPFSMDDVAMFSDSAREQLGVQNELKDDEPMDNYEQKKAEVLEKIQNLSSSITPYTSQELVDKVNHFYDELVAIDGIVPANQEERAKKMQQLKMIESDVIDTKFQLLLGDIIL